MKSPSKDVLIPLTLLGILVIISSAKVLGFNDESRGIVKWNPYFLSSSSRYPGSSSFYGDSPLPYYGSGLSRGGSASGFGFPKRIGERSSLFGTGQQIYKWSPVYFSDRGIFGHGGGQRYLNVISNDALDSTEN